MDMEKYINILDQRKFLVFKSNNFIQKSRYELSVQEQKIVLRLIQLVKPTDVELKVYDFSIQEFCNLCGIDSANGGNYINIKKTLKTLADKSYWMKLEDGRETLVRWIDKPFISKKNGVIQLKLDNEMAPFLLNLIKGGFFTAYSYYYTLPMKSKYSIRIFELLKSYENLKIISLNIDELKKQLMCERYKFSDFKKYVIDSSVVEINEYSDIKVSYVLRKKGKKFDSIIFTISPKTGLDETIELYTKINDKLNPNYKNGQLSFLPPNDELSKIIEENEEC